MNYNLSNDIDIKRYETRFKALLLKGANVELKETKKKRTVSQNAYLHVLFNLYAIENGYTSKEAKELVKDNCPFLKYKKKGEEFTRGT